MKVPCTVIKDLLPLYHDSVCSPETAALVEEHLRECESCQEEFHRLEDAPLPPAAPEKEEKKAEGLKRIQQTLHRRWVKVAAITAVVAIVLCYGGFLILQLPLMGVSVEAVHKVSVEEDTDRLVVNFSSTFGGLSTTPLPAEEGSKTGGTIAVLGSTYCLADPITHFFQGTLQWMKEQSKQGYDFFIPLTAESNLRYGDIPWIEELDEESMEAMRSSTELMFPGGDYSAVYFYTGPALKYSDHNYLRKHLEDQCTLLWTAQDGVVYQP